MGGVIGAVDKLMTAMLAVTPMPDRIGRMALAEIPADIERNYEIHEWKHACAVLATDFADEFNDIVEVLRGFRLNRSDALTPGGGRSPVSRALDSSFYDRGWEEKAFDTMMVVDQHEMKTPTHKVDCFKNRIALEIEWSNKDPFYDRDLNNFRLLFDLRAISVGVIITKSDDLKPVFKGVPAPTPKEPNRTLYEKYGASTTWMSKLLPRIEGGGGGGCPLLVFGISAAVWVED